MGVVKEIYHAPVHVPCLDFVMYPAILHAKTSGNHRLGECVRLFASDRAEAGQRIMGQSHSLRNLTTDRINIKKCNNL